jgi:hypothetical protein
MSSSLRRKFLDVFPIIKTELVEQFKSQGMPEEAVKWYADVSFFALWLVS